MTPDRAKAARELLAFYLDAGVVDLVGETPIDRLAEPSASQMPQLPGRTGTSPVAAEAGRGSLSESPLPTASRTASTTPDELHARNAGAGTPIGRASIPAPSMPVSPEAAAMAAREAAASAASLPELRAILQRFEGCALRLTAKQLVFADGNPAARVMFVGEAPGREEDIEGLPFVGRSGQLLDRMLKAIGLDRSSVYIANVIPWRPPGNRTPTPQETAICRPFIRRQIELADPDVLVCLGGPSMQTLLGIKDGVRRVRGRWFPYDTGTREIRALPTFHPAYLLRSPLEKRPVWRDFLAIKKALAG